MIALWVIFGLSVLATIQEIPGLIAYYGSVDELIKEPSSYYLILLPILYQIPQIFAYRAILKFVKPAKA